MVTAFLVDETEWCPILRHHVWRESLIWLQKHAATAEFGDYSFSEPDWYANVHGYSTLPESECCWENHKHTIDIQYLIIGSEKIHWVNVSQLGAPRCYIENKDRQEFDMPCDNTAQLTLKPGMFAIFLPGEAHCPKIALEESEVLRKVVVKIPAYLV